MKTTAESFKEGLRKRNLLQPKTKKQQEAFLKKKIVQLEEENKILFQDKMSVTRKYETLRASKIKKSNEKNSLDLKYQTLNRKNQKLKEEKNELRLENIALKKKMFPEQYAVKKLGAQIGNKNATKHGLYNTANYRKEYLKKYRKDNAESIAFKRAKKFKALPEEEKEIIRARDRKRHLENKDIRSQQQKQKRLRNKKDPLWVRQEQLRSFLRTKKLTEEQIKTYSAERIKVIAEMKRRKNDVKTN